MRKKNKIDINELPETKLDDIIEIYDKSLKNDFKNDSKSSYKEENSNLNDAALSASGFENDTRNDANVNKSINNLLISVSDVISSDEKGRAKIKKPIIVGMTLYFLVMTGFVAYVILCFSKSDTLIRFLLGGFFTNLIGLIVIIFKYIFAPSKDLYDLLIRLEDRYQSN